MSKLESFSQVLGYPVSCCEWLDDGRVVVGGGGGCSKSGVKNSLILYQVSWEKASLVELGRAALTAGEDSPTSMSISRKLKTIACGINGTPESIKKGTNQSLRLFQIDNNEITPKESRRIIQGTNANDYQRVTRFDSEGKVLLVAAAEGQVSALSYPDLKPCFGSKKCENEDIHGGDISTDSKILATASDKAVHFFDSCTGELMHTINQPRGLGKRLCYFRSVLFGRQQNDEHVYAAINAVDRKNGYLAKFNLEDFSLVFTRSVAPSAILCFNTSESGHLLAVGCSDLSIRICCPRTLRVLARLPSAHSFPVTHLAFSPDGKFLLSGSADGTCRVIKIPEKFDDLRWVAILILVLFFLLVGVAVYLSNQAKLPLETLLPPTSSDAAPVEDEL